MPKIYAMVVPEGIPEKLWFAFINEKCSNCTERKGECTEDYAVVKQAKKCFKEWLKEKEHK